MYKILLTKRALKDIDKIEINSQNKLINKIKILVENPYTHSKKLSSPVIGMYRLKVGDFRVIFDIDEDNIVVLRVGHRKDIYR
jgi:mRNA interferase RelE/StbE